MRSFVTVTIFLVFMLVGFTAAPRAAGPKPAAPTLAAGQNVNPPVVTGSQFFAWDYTDAQIANAAVNRFEMSIDAGAFGSIGMATKIDGQEAYKIAIPPLPTGTHTVSLRACNANICSDQSSPLSFVLTVQPTPVGTVRIIGG